MKTIRKIIIREASDMAQLRLDCPEFNAVLEFVNKYSIAIPMSCIKIVSANRLRVLEFYRDKHHNLIYREYEKD